MPTDRNKIAQEKQNCVEALVKGKLLNDSTLKSAVSWDKTPLRRGQCNAKIAIILLGTDVKQRPCSMLNYCFQLYM